MTLAQWRISLETVLQRLSAPKACTGFILCVDPCETPMFFRPLLVAALFAVSTASALAAPSKAEFIQALVGGYWENTDFISIEKFEQVHEPLTPAYAAKRQEQINRRAKGLQVFTPESRCIPSGMPRQMMAGGFEAMVRDNSIGLLTTGRGLEVRTIWIDGRKPTADDELFDSFSGEAIGHWEGDVLVVDTHGLRPTNEFLYGVAGHKMTIRERFRFTAPGALEVTTTITDPVVFTTPWTYVYHYRRVSTRGASEQNYCINALDRSVDENGVETMNLTPPPAPDQQ